MRHSNTKMTWERVRDLREKLFLGWTQAELARWFNLSIGQVGKICRNEAWREESFEPQTDRRQEPLTASAAAQSLDKLAGLLSGHAGGGLADQLMAEAQALREKTPNADRMLEELANQDLERKGK